MLPISGDFNNPSTSTDASPAARRRPRWCGHGGLVAERQHHQIGGAVQHFRSVEKIRRRIDEAPSRTTRTTLSRSPVAALICANRLMAQPRAAALPCSTVTPAPSLPLAISYLRVEANLETNKLGAA